MFTAFFTKEFSADFDSLDSAVQAIAEKRMDRIMTDPHSGKELHGEPGLFRERFLNYRLIYQLHGNEIWFLKLKKREKAYD